MSEKDLEKFMEGEKYGIPKGLSSEGWEWYYNRKDAVKICKAREGCRKKRKKRENNILSSINE